MDESKRITIFARDCCMHVTATGIQKGEVEVDDWGSSKIRLYDAEITIGHMRADWEIEPAIKEVMK